jgi:hypothetical protein
VAGSYRNVKLPVQCFDLNGCRVYRDKSIGWSGRTEASAVTIRPWLLAILAGAALWSPARATSEYEYARGEDVVIDGGLAPNGRLSLATHGEGPSGNEKFHLYLMAEPKHHRIAALDDINSDNILDSGPGAFHASWAPDSHHAAVSFRTDRHVIVTMLYRIERGRAVPIGGPTLFTDVTSRAIHSSKDDERVSVSKLSWLGPRRFRLEEKKWFMTSAPNLLRSLGRYGKQTEETDGTRSLIKFSAVAECELAGGNRYRIVDLKPGGFDD